MTILLSSLNSWEGPLYVWPNIIKKREKEEKTDGLLVLCELVLNYFYKKQTDMIFFKCKKNGVKVRPGSEGRLGSGRGLGRGVCGGRGGGINSIK